MLSIISNMLAINESLLWMGDVNGTAAKRITNLVDRFTSEVSLEKGESITLATENLVVKAVSWDVETNGLEGEDLTFSVHYQARKRREYSSKGKSRVSAPQESFWSESHSEGVISFYNDAELTIPLEALLLAQNQTYQELRIKFVAYKNDKFFREKPTPRWQQCYDSQKYRMKYNCLYTGTSKFPGRHVLQASILNATITNLSNPVAYMLPSPTNVKVFCAYWREQDRVWSTDNMITNQTGNSTLCFSTHLTSFSLFVDPTQNEGIHLDQILPLTFISYIGCAISMLGLTLTILTYSMFRCLNRDSPGQILIQLCISLLMMNATFVLGSQRGQIVGELDFCTTVAVLIHYFLMSSLMWMCIEIINMHQLLVHVFVTTDSHFMLKRSILAWGIPFIIVGITVLLDWEVYFNQNEYCMLTVENPYVYYISFLGPCCLILLTTVTVFLMVARILLISNNATTKKTPQCNKKDKSLITVTQIKGAFTIMVLFGISWIFGAFIMSEAKLIFHYIFCISNSLQGVLMFIVRCLRYPEAKSAWCQLLKTGTLKKYRGTVPPGNWSSNSNSTKQNGHTAATCLGDTDLTNSGPFNTDTFWGEKGSLPIGVSETSKDDCCDIGFNDPLPTIPSDVVLNYSTTHRGSAQLLTFSGSASTLKSPINRDDKFRSLKPKSLSRSNSETSQDIPKINNDKARTEMSTTFGPETVESTDIDYNGMRGMIQQDSCTDSSQLTSVPVETKRRSLYGSEIGCIVQDHDKIAVNTLDRKIYASKASNLFGNVKSDSPPELDKQNSWPRTLSSFLSGKEPLKFAVSGINSGSKKCDHCVMECHNHHLCQGIPLQVRPTTPSIMPSYSSKIRDSEFIQISPSVHSPLSDTASLPDRTISHVSHQTFHPHHSSIPTDRYLHIISKPSSIGLQVPLEREDEEKEDLDVNNQIEPITESETTHNWERDGVISPSTTMFKDSASSRL